MAAVPKILDALEHDRATEAELEGRKYQFILDEPYRWEAWAAPKDLVGKLDHNNALTGDDLRDFVNLKLFPYLHGFKAKATGPNTIEYKIGEIFGEIRNKIQSGYNLREVVEVIDTLRFRSQKEKHELSHLYEAKIKNMGNAGRKAWDKPLTEGVAQAKSYAGKLAVRFTYATNGQAIYGIDMADGAEGELPQYPSPDELGTEFSPFRFLGVTVLPLFLSRTKVAPGEHDITRTSPSIVCSKL